MNKLDVTCFQIISNVGSAKSLYIEAIQLAKKQQIEDARNKINEGEELYRIGHKVHYELVTKMANGEDVPVNLLLLHAEDQLMATDTFCIMAKEIVELYEKLYN